MSDGLCAACRLQKPVKECAVSVSVKTDERYPATVVPLRPLGEVFLCEGCFSIGLWASVYVDGTNQGDEE